MRVYGGSLGRMIVLVFVFSVSPSFPPYFLSLLMTRDVS
jgi:hypothetical protein